MRGFIVLMLALTISPVFADPPKITKVDISTPADFQQKYNLAAGDVLALIGGDSSSVWSATGLTKNYFLWQKDGFVVFNVPSNTAKDTQFILSCSSKGEISQALVTIGSGKEPPVPDPIKPDDALVKKFQEEYNADKSPVDELKPKALAKLIALYDAAQGEARNGDNTSVSALRTQVLSAGEALMQQFISENKLPKGTESKLILPKLREMIAAQVVLAFFEDDAQLGPDERKKAEELFKKIATSLRSVK